MARSRRDTLKRDWFEKVALVRNDQADEGPDDDEFPLPTTIAEQRAKAPSQIRASA